MAGVSSCRAWVERRVIVEQVEKVGRRMTKKWKRSRVNDVKDGVWAVRDMARKCEAVDDGMLYVEAWGVQSKDKKDMGSGKEGVEETRGLGNEGEWQRGKE